MMITVYGVHFLYLTLRNVMFQVEYSSVPFCYPDQLEPLRIHDG